MRLSMQVIVAVITLWLALVAAAHSLPRAKQPRATRGFKNTGMMTARGFGKRALNLELPQTHPLGSTEDMSDELQDIRFSEQEDKVPENIPVGWFVNELMNNPELAMTVVLKFMDTNQDGVLTRDELLRVRACPENAEISSFNL